MQHAIYRSVHRCLYLNYYLPLGPTAYAGRIRFYIGKKLETPTTFKLVIFSFELLTKCVLSFAENEWRYRRAD